MIKAFAKLELIDAGLKKFILNYYVTYLGVLYCLIYLLSLIIIMFRNPFLNWYLQHDFIVLAIKTNLTLLLLGASSCFYGTYKVIHLSRGLKMTLRYLIAALSIFLPIVMCFTAILSARYVVPLLLQIRY